MSKASLAPRNTVEASLSTASEDPTNAMATIEDAVASTQATTSTTVEGMVLLLRSIRFPNRASTPNDTASVRYNVNCRSKKKGNEPDLISPMNIGVNKTR